MRCTQFAWMFIPLISGVMLGSAVTSHRAGRTPPGRMVRRGFTLMAVGAILNIAINLSIPPQVPWTVLPLTVYTFGFALMVPVVTIEGLDLFPHHKGLASSLQGFTHVLVFAIVAGLVAPLVYRSALKHAFGQALLMFLSWLAYQGYHIKVAVAKGSEP